MFNRVLPHGSDIKKPHTTKAEAIKFVQMRLSKIIPEALESVIILFDPFYKYKFFKYWIMRTESGYSKILSDSQPEASSGVLHLIK